MSSDPNKKSGRTFQCRDVLWETFEQMARELECSVDYLINESMKQYARQRSYGARTPFPGQGQGAGQGQPGQARDQGNNTGAPPRVQEAQSPPSSDPQPQGRGGYGPPPPAAVRPPPRGGGLPPPPARVAPPPMRASNLPAPPPAGLTGGMGGMSAPRGMSSLPTPPPRGAGLQMPQAPSRSAPPPAPPPAPRSVPPPIPRGMPAATNGFPAPASNPTTLSVIYQGEKAAVTKDRFIIGRGKQSSDLTLKDPNVSRQHAMIEFQNGVYFMVDMGSTNGVEYNGQRIARKQIAEGDTFRICDHDLFFTYR